MKEGDRGVIFQPMTKKSTTERVKVSQMNFRKGSGRTCDSLESESHRAAKKICVVVGFTVQSHCRV